MEELYDNEYWASLRIVVLNKLIEISELSPDERVKAMATHIDKTPGCNGNHFYTMIIKLATNGEILVPAAVTTKFNAEPEVCFAKAILRHYTLPSSSAQQ